MGIALGIGRGLTIGHSSQSWSAYWTTQSEVLFFGEISKITDGKLYNQKTGSTDFLTVGGVAGSYTFQAPNTASYIAVDTDYIWFRTDATQRITTEAELIGYDFTRSIIKYEDVSDYSIQAIMILSLNVDTAKMRNDFHLSIWWSNISSNYGYEKGNRIGEKSVWTGHQAEVTTYITGLTTALSNTHLANLDTLVGSLKTGLSIANLSDVFDVMYILGGETEESSLKNLIKNAHHATAVNAPAFAAFEGFTGANTKYLNTNYNPATQGVRFTQNDASIGLYSRTDRAENSYDTASSIGTSYIQMITKYGSGTGYYSLNIPSTSNISYSSTPDTLGSFIITRNGNAMANFSLYKNKTEAGVKIGADVTVPVNNQNLYILCMNDDSAATGFSTRQLSLWFVGNHITTAMRDIIVDAFEAYMDSNIKGVIT